MVLEILDDLRAAELGFPPELGVGLILKAGSCVEKPLPHVAAKLISAGKARWAETVNDQATQSLADTQVEVKPTSPLENKPNKPKSRK